MHLRINYSFRKAPAARVTLFETAARVAGSHAAPSDLAPWSALYSGVRRRGRARAHYRRREEGAPGRSGARCAQSEKGKRPHLLRPGRGEQRGRFPSGMVRKFGPPDPPTPLPPRGQGEPREGKSARRPGEPPKPSVYVCVKPGAPRGTYRAASLPLCAGVSPVAPRARCLALSAVTVAPSCTVS